MLTLLYFRGGSTVAAAESIAAPSGGGLYYLKRRKSLNEQINELVAQIGEPEEQLEVAARQVVAEQEKSDTPIARMGAPSFAAARAEIHSLRIQLAELEARAFELDDEEVLLLAA